MEKPWLAEAGKTEAKELQAAVEEHLAEVEQTRARERAKTMQAQLKMLP